jgi:CHAT domain-containing protein
VVAWPPHDSLSPLPFTQVEVSQIARLFPASRREVLLGDSATLGRTQKLLEGSQHRYVHFATHGVVDENHPELSGLVLTPEGNDDGFLPLLQIYRMRLAARLVVLSACQTAVGKQVAGEGLLGMARGFLHAGARGVVASLWSVPDESTSVLMSALYAHLARGLGHAAALQAAQVQLATGSRFSHPRHWAAFEVIGR